MNDNEDVKVTRFWQSLYIEKEANPLDPRTDKEFAQEVGVDPNNLAKWKQRNRKQIYNEVNRRRSEFLAEIRAKNLKAILKNIEESFNDRKLLAQITGDLIERVETKAEIMGPEDQERRKNALLQNILQKVQAVRADDKKDSTEDPSVSDGEQGKQPGTDSLETGTA